MACLVALILGGVLLSAVLFAIVFRLFIARSYYVPSAAMEPGIAKGSIILVSMVAYRPVASTPRRFDIVVFQLPGKPGIEYIKRVIALPGETVEIRAGEVFINGKRVQRSFYVEAAQEDFAQCSVPPDCYFVLGDNLNHSDDSRAWGCVPRGNITGKVVRVLYKPRR